MRRLRRWCLRLGMLGVVALVLVVFHRPMLVHFACLFRVNDPVPSDALVLLLGGYDYRTPAVAALYRHGLAPLVLLAESGEVVELGVNETKITRRSLVRLRVPKEAIHVLPGPVVHSTHDEALRLRDYAKAHPELRRITVVTASFHTARARWIFKRVLKGTGIEVHTAAVPWRAVDEANWYMTEHGLLTYFIESFKTIYYRIVY
jgi:uncharacterized SAM-binding protein YcdF (DUF218 family)